jgi:hypothetical protein
MSGENPLIVHFCIVLDQIKSSELSLILDSFVNAL